MKLDRGEASVWFMPPSGLLYRRKDSAKKVFFEFMQGLIYSDVVTTQEIFFKLKKMDGDLNGKA